MKSEPIIFNYGKSIQKFPVIQLEVNPETLTLNWRKIVTRVRTKSRIVSFYWGQEPVNFTYRGQTGNLYTSKLVDEFIKKRTEADSKTITDLKGRNNAIDILIERVNNQLIVLRDAGRSNSSEYDRLSLELDELTLEKVSNSSSISQLGTAVAEAYTHTEILELSPKYIAFKKLEKLFESSQDVNQLMKVKYRKYIFEGYFETFSFTDSGTNPWNWIYELSFTVLRWEQIYGDTVEQEFLLVKEDAKTS